MNSDTQKTQDMFGFVYNESVLVSKLLIQSVKLTDSGVLKEICLLFD
jgi:hypothetical protein